MYTDIDFKTKKALREAFAAGKTLTVYQPGPFGTKAGDYEDVIEGPHYPRPHTWYARVRISGGRIVKILS